MPKQKTKRAAAKRFSLTANGKVKRKQAYASHILTTKSPKRKRNLRQTSTISNSTEAKNIKQLIPYK